MFASARRNQARCIEISAGRKATLLMITMMHSALQVLRTLSFEGCVSDCHELDRSRKFLELHSRLRTYFIDPVQESDKGTVFLQLVLSLSVEDPLRRYRS